jgi:hypothetical protein
MKGEKNPEKVEALLGCQGNSHNVPQPAVPTTASSTQMGRRGNLKSYDGQSEERKRQIDQGK